MKVIRLTAFLLFALGVTRETCAADTIYRSHPPLRTVPPSVKRPVVEVAVHFVDAAKGDDKNDGGKTAPWRTIAHALRQLKAGDTLYLRGGVYYGDVRISLAGRKGAPITIASFPGEQAILDAGLREFFETPAECWEPNPQGAAGEFRSTRLYANLRNFVGSFGDSQVGLHTYYHAKDLRAMDEHVEREADKSDVKPVYCGPGIWYERETGRLHARLAHTHLADMDNYRGETDPRKLPLVIAPFRALPLHLDRAEHIRLHDLVIRGGGYNTVLIDQSNDLEFDNVTVWCGMYGLRAKGAQRLRLHRCGFYGNAPPWQTRFEAGFNSYPGRTTRDITRYNTHAWLVPEANGEFDVYSFPFNDDWEISYCEFGDAGADGLYLGGVSMRFHHNLVDNTTDDGVYLSPMYARHVGLYGKAKLLLYQNYFRRALTMFAVGGTEKENTDTIYFHRNIVDLRAPVRNARPSKPGGTVAAYAGKLAGDHGSPPWPAQFSYHNTFIARTPAIGGADMWTSRGATPDRPRRVFNNIFVHGEVLPRFTGPASPLSPRDASIYWQPGLDAKVAGAYLTAFRATPAFSDSKKIYPPGFDSGSLAADPKFVKFDLDFKVANDYRLQASSPAVDAGVDLPSDWPDPLRMQDKGKPDIGALPFGVESFRAGRSAAP